MPPLPSRTVPAARAAAALLLLLALGACGVLGRRQAPVDRSEDPRIREEVEARLAREPSLRGAPIRVQVDGRVVRLHGSVDGIGAWYCAATAAELVAGVRTVVNDLAIRRGPREVRCLAPGPAPAPTAGA